MSLASSSIVESSRASIRKANKPLLEKRRRARINASLNQLKTIVLETLQKDSARYSKLEKADILEMTVVHLKSLRQQQRATNSHGDFDQYGAGYRECVNEIRRYLDTVGYVDVPVLTRLEYHLEKCARKMDQASVERGVASEPGPLLLSTRAAAHQPRLNIFCPHDVGKGIYDTTRIDVAEFNEESAKTLECGVAEECDFQQPSTLLFCLGVSSLNPPVSLSPLENANSANLRSVKDENDVVGLSRKLEYHNAEYLRYRHREVMICDSSKSSFFAEPRAVDGMASRSPDDTIGKPMWRPW